MINTRFNNLTRAKFTSPPTTTTQQQESVPENLDTVTFSAAKAKSGPGIGTLQKVGLGIGLAVALGGAFVAGVHFSEAPQEPTLESQVEDAGISLKRGFQDLKKDLKRGGGGF